jgi:hypothetical protein
MKTIRVVAILGSTLLSTPAWAADEVFVPNRGQWDTPARFVGTIAGTVLRLERGAILLQRECGGRGALVALRFERSEARELVGEGRRPGVHNFYFGQDTARWRTGLPGFDGVRYEDLYPGVDLRVHGSLGVPEYDLQLEPGADVAAIEVRCEGAEGLSVDADGALVIDTALGELRSPPPATWELATDGARIPVACRYRLLDDARFGFDLEGRDAQRPLVIDPGLVWATFFGGDLIDDVNDLLVLPDQSTVVVGGAPKQSFPTTPGSWQAPAPGLVAAYVTRVAADGKSLIFSTLFGGGFHEEGRAVAVASNGDLVFAGVAYSLDLPVTPGVIHTTKSGVENNGDGFVARLTGDGGALVFATYLTGQPFTTVTDIALRSDDGIVVSGGTSNAGFPATPGAFQTAIGGTSSPADGYVAELAPDATAWIAATFLGGSELDATAGLLLMPDGSPLVGGETKSPDFPVTAGAWKHGFGGNFDGFVTHLSPDLTALLASTYVGSFELDKVMALERLPDGNLLLAGPTRSWDFPVSPEAFDPVFNDLGTMDPTTDLFLLRLSPDLGTRLWSSFLGGGSTEDFKIGLAVDSAGTATIFGETTAALSGARPFPTTPGAFQTKPKGLFTNNDMFLSRVNPSGTVLTYSTLYGGTGTEDNGSFTVPSLGLTPEGDAIVAAHSSSADLVLGIPDPFSGSPQGSQDAFVARFDLLPTGVTRYGNSTPGCQGPMAISAFTQPQAGKAFTLTSTHGPASAGGWLLLSPGGLAVPLQVGGLSLWVDPAGLVRLPVASDANGYAEFELHDLPAGLAFAAQFAWPKTCSSPPSWSGTAALSVVVQP